MRRGSDIPKSARAIALVCCLAGVAITAGPAVDRAEADGSTRPSQPRFDIAVDENQEVVSFDGTVLRGDVYFPADPETGKAAKGPFPTILIQTPYTKFAAGSLGTLGGSNINYFAQRGYIVAVVDVRGTGNSEGSFGLFQPAERRDGALLVDWASRLPHASGRVGTAGPSYLGINQLLTASEVGKNSALKAAFPVIPANDPYRDLVTEGGVSNAEFGAIFVGLTGSLNTAGPAAESLFQSNGDPGAIPRTELQHAGGTIDFNLLSTSDLVLSGDRVFDSPYWRVRAPVNLLEKVERNGVPVFLTGGWYDLFQRGTSRNYSGLQNAAAGRSVRQPMAPGVRPTGRYQLLMGPWYHLTAGQGLDLDAIAVKWFDRWLKGRRNGIDETSSPFHAFQINDGRYLDLRRYPIEHADPTRYFLSAGPSEVGAPSTNDGRLERGRPTVAPGVDEVTYTGASNPCSLQTAIHSAGAVVPEPCVTDDSGIQSGPGALTYTTAPLERPRVLAGPMSATLRVVSSRPDALLLATVEDVAPDGTSQPLTYGGLLGSQRELDSSRTWRGEDGSKVAPYHPFEAGTARLMVPGQVERLDLEIYPTFARIAKGHSLRLTVTTGDSPHLLPNTAQSADLLGGVYEVQRNAEAASSIELPLARADAFKDRCRICH